MFGNNNPEKTMEKATEYIKNGEFYKAKELYLECLANDPDNIALLNNLSQVYGILGDSSKAKGYSENLLKECNRHLEYIKSEELLILKINALVTLEKIDEAIETIDELLNVNPDNQIALYHKSQYLEKNKRHEEALTYIERILKNDPYDIAAILSKGRNLVELDEFDEAEACYNLVFEMDSQNKAAIHLKSQLLKRKNRITLTSHDMMLKAVESFEREDFDTSIDYYQKALEINPEYDEIWFAQGELFVRTGYIKKAISSFEKAFEINPRSGGITDQDDFFKMLNKMKKINTILGFEK